ncbi:MAG: KipI antagonist, partial [Pyrinomonadaceae bacterium]|nr:KipI antagonist [Pyrinomonadaceae bacterium]
MSILIEKRGVFDSIQDLGRQGFRKFGINPSGVMDRAAARLINTLLGNDEDEAVLEMHFPAPVIRFQKDAIIALGGANFEASIEDENLRNWQAHTVSRGSVLRFTKKHHGNRCYLAVKGGFEIKRWLGSASTNSRARIGGFEGRTIENGDEIRFSGVKTLDMPMEKPIIARSLVPRYNNSPIIRFIAGAE